MAGQNGTCTYINSHNLASSLQTSTVELFTQCTCLFLRKAQNNLPKYAVQDISANELQWMGMLNVTVNE